MRTSRLSHPTSSSRTSRTPRTRCSSLTELVPGLSGGARTSWTSCSGAVPSTQGQLARTSPTSATRPSRRRWIRPRIWASRIRQRRTSSGPRSTRRSPTRPRGSRCSTRSTSTSSRSASEVPVQPPVVLPSRTVLGGRDRQGHATAEASPPAGWPAALGHGLRRLCRDRSAWRALILFVLIVVVSFAAPFYATSPTPIRSRPTSPGSRSTGRDVLQQSAGPRDWRHADWTDVELGTTSSAPTTRAGTSWPGCSMVGATRF